MARLLTWKQPWEGESMFSCVGLDDFEAAAHFAKSEDDQADEGRRQGHRCKHRRNLRNRVVVAFPDDIAEPQRSNYSQDHSSSFKSICHRAPLYAIMP